MDTNICSSATPAGVLARLLPKTNPARTNNPRDRLRAASDTTSQDGSEGTESPGSFPTRESLKKLDQIIQNFYAKAAVVILQSRINTASVGTREDGKKPNKWFSLETDDIEDFREELRVYKQSSSFENPPPPMIIETYIDASGLSSSQSLVLLDDNGKRWDVMEALSYSETPDDSSRRRHSQKRKAEVVLERWKIELKCLPDLEQDDFGPILPTVYKRSIVFFRSLFLTTRVMPCWKYSQQALAKGIHPALEVKCRVLSAEPEFAAYDPLRLPLHDARDITTEYVFTDLEVPVGRFYASVTYRNDCNFRVDDAESLLSSRFMGGDESYFKPSIPQSIEQPNPPHSLPIRGAAARPTMRTFETTNRRPSVSFQPFKAGSLSGSPRIPDEAPSSSSPQSLTRPSLAGLARPGNRSSLTAGMAASLRGAPTAPQDVPTVSGSPRPTGRYSSSFSHRRGRPSYGGQSKGDDDQVSSGKQSLSSSAQPGSGFLAEAGGFASSGSFATDDDNISEFLKALDSRKTLKSFEPNKKGESVASKRTAAQLSKFQQMRDSNNVLSESITSSIHLQRSSSSSSRQLANVPSMVNPASMASTVSIINTSTAP
ncbi:autophagy protein 13 [Collariella sp. IMI 366227]|nr:autophagy protein 13 [Collariella sp. IMI 366227]